MTEAEMIRRAKSGDQDAKLEVVLRNRHLLTAAVRRMGITVYPDDADDVKSIVDLALLLAIQACDGERPFGTYAVYGIMAQLQRYYRQKYRWRASQAKEASPPERCDSPVQSACDSEHKQLMHAGVAALPDGLRVVVQKTYGLIGEPTEAEEIASELGVKRPAVSMRKKKALRLLRKRLSRESEAEAY